MNLTECDLDQCAVARCRRASEIIFSQGATPWNRSWPVGLCDKHAESAFAVIRTGKPKQPAAKDSDDRDE